MTNNEVFTPTYPVVKLAVCQSSSGKFRVGVKVKFLTESSKIHPAKVLSQIDLTDVKNTPFFTVEGKSNLVLARPEFCEKVTNISKELGIRIDSLVVRTMSFPDKYPHKIIFTQSLPRKDKGTQKWEATFIKQVEIVANLLDETVIVKS